MQFQNPANDYIESSSSPLSWLWCLLFGPIYFLVKGNFFHALVHFLLSAMTFGIAMLIYPFFVYGINRTYYLKRGWKVYVPAKVETVETSKEEDDKQQALINRAKGIYS
jgi:hypothetical protein